jgi:hypothetical protein
MKVTTLRDRDEELLVVVDAASRAVAVVAEEDLLLELGPKRLPVVDGVVAVRRSARSSD